MALTLNGSTNTIAGVAVGGLPDGIVDTDMIAAKAVTTAKSTGLGEADKWRITANFTGNATPIGSNWERFDTYGSSVLGTGMSQSNGVFDFPSTGYWHVIFQMCFRSTVESDHCGGYIQFTQDNTNNWNATGTTYTHIARTGGSNSVYSQTTMHDIYDITDVSTHKVAFSVEVQDSSVVTMGHTNESQTYATFVRLGDT